MERVTVTLTEEDVTHLDGIQDAESRSEAVRQCVESHRSAYREAGECERRLAECEKECDDLETTVERLRNEKMLILKREKETTALAEYVEDQREKENSGLLSRLRGALSGGED